MKHINVTQVIQNLQANIQTKALVVGKTKRNAFILSNNQFGLKLNYKSDKLKAADFSSTTLRRLKHKRLKALTISAYVPENHSNKTFKATNSMAKIFATLKAKKPILSARLQSPVRGGFILLTANGFRGFIYKKEIKKIALQIYKKATAKKSLKAYFANKIEELSKVKFLVKLSTVKYIVPQLKTSKRYLMFKDSGYLNITFKSLIKSKHLKPAAKKSELDFKPTFKSKNFKNAKKKN